MDDEHKRGENTVRLVIILAAIVLWSWGWFLWDEGKHESDATGPRNGWHSHEQRLKSLEGKR